MKEDRNLYFICKNIYKRIWRKQPFVRLKMCLRWWNTKRGNSAFWGINICKVSDSKGSISAPSPLVNLNSKGNLCSLSLSKRRLNWIYRFLTVLLYYRILQIAKKRRRDSEDDTTGINTKHVLPLTSHHTLAKPTNPSSYLTSITVSSNLSHNMTKMRDSANS